MAAYRQAEMEPLRGMAVPAIQRDQPAVMDQMALYSLFIIKEKTWLIQFWSSLKRALSASSLG